MELVYLWVDKYKNIHEQGFNFSPMFLCEYDKDSNELTIKNNEDYIPDFFGENINVTAIVGKNGSGKSSVLELLMKIANKYTLLEFHCFFIYKENDIWYKVGKNQIFCSSVDIQDSWFNIDESINWINYTNTRNDVQLKKYIEKQTPFNEQGSNLIYKQVHVYSQYPSILKNLKDKYLFTKFQLQMGLKSKDFQDNNILSNNDIEICEQVITKIYSGRDISNRVSYSSKPLSKENQLAYNSFLFTVYFYQVSLYPADSRSELQQSFSNYIDKILKSEFEDLDLVSEILDNFKDVLEKVNNLPYLFASYDANVTELIFIKDNINKFEYKNNNYIWEVDLTNIEKIKFIIQNTETISGIKPKSVYEDIYMADCISYNFINSEKNLYYNNLSEAEKEILKISVDYIHHLDINKNKNVLLLLDEIDNSLHPIWKKGILSIKISIFREFKKLHNQTNLHLILTTHSPFLISDIPKQNIIFLDKDEQGNCKVVDGLNDKKQTFGANIHTLLSDSFFMEDGLMGEFAKSKIDRVIKLLNHEHLNEDDLKYCEQIISIIGEPIVKNQLQRMIDSKKLSYLAKDTKEEIEFLKHRIDLLSKRL